MQHGDGFGGRRVAGPEQFLQPTLQCRPAQSLGDDVQLAIQEIRLGNAVNAVELGDRVSPTEAVKDVRIV